MIKHPYFDITGGNIDRGGKPNARLKRENAKLREALEEIKSQATRLKRASDLKRYLITDLEIIEEKSSKALSQTE